MMVGLFNDLEPPKWRKPHHKQTRMYVRMVVNQFRIRKQSTWMSTVGVGIVNKECSAGSNLGVTLVEKEWIELALCCRCWLS